MSNRLNDFVSSLVGSDGRSGVKSVESIRAVDENTLGVVFDDPETFRPDLQTKAEDAGVSLSDVERAGNNQTAVMARDDNSFFSDPLTSDRGKRRVAPTDIQREPNGEFTYPLSETTSAPNSPARRGPDGQFVSNEIEDADIGRRESNGFFDLLR